MFLLPPQSMGATNCIYTETRAQNLRSGSHLILVCSLMAHTGVHSFQIYPPSLRLQVVILAIYGIYWIPHQCKCATVAWLNVHPWARRCTLDSSGCYLLCAPHRMKFGYLILIILVWSAPECYVYVNVCGRMCVCLRSVEVLYPINLYEVCVARLLRRQHTKRTKRLRMWIWNECLSTICIYP